jgi:hypothetical protein
MPQHLKIDVEGELVAWLSTSNKGGTLYDVSLCVPELNIDIPAPNVDTGVERQPQDPEARAAEFRNDFTHARRCIAAAVRSADNFLHHLREHGTPEYAEMKPIVMQLMTNHYDRGFIQVHPSDDGSVDVDVVIGHGPNRVPNSSPKDECKLTWEGIDASGVHSQTERALKVVRSIGPELLRALEEQPPTRTV